MRWRLSPFVGGGIAFMATSSSEELGRSGSGSGFGGYGDVGMEFLRTHRSRFIVDLRVDAPFYEHTGYRWSEAGGSATTSIYAMPISIGAMYAF